MSSDHRCFFCFTGAFEKLLEKENISNELKRSFTLDMIMVCTLKRIMYGSILEWAGNR
jgi:hypothetical protein